MIHESSSLSPHDHDSHHPSFPFIAIAIIGIFGTIFLLLFYYIFVIKCCLNWHRIDVLGRFSLSRTRSTDAIVPSSPEFTGLHESVIRSIPIFHFRKQKHLDNDKEYECAVCLGEFQDDEKLRIIPNCAHVFHIDCIDVWLQNNPNCPLCRNSISMHIQQYQPYEDDKNYVVIELHNSNVECGDQRTTDVGDGGNVSRNLNTTEPRVAKKMMRKRYGYDHSSMGDECIGVNTRLKGENQFLTRRSFSMDSASDRQLYFAIQEIRNSLNNVDVNEVNDGCSCSSSNSILIKRGFFSFGHAKTILPCHLKSKTSI